VTTSELLAYANSIRDEDTRQEAILGMLQAGDDLDHSEARAICRRARFRAAWAVRQQENRTVSLEVLGEHTPDTAPPVKSGAISAAFRLLASLTENERQAFLLHHVSGYSTADIAELLGVHRSSIWNWLKSARKKFDRNSTGAASTSLM
jgi:RNA polymerase sigma factor (sigma-70 family)